MTWLQWVYLALAVLATMSLLGIGLSLIDIARELEQIRERNDQDDDRRR